jgi:hypothetical protein
MGISIILRLRQVCEGAEFLCLARNRIDGAYEKPRLDFYVHFNGCAEADMCEDPPLVVDG